MNDFDDGEFHYSNDHPPLYIQPTENQLCEFRESMVDAVPNYLKNSIRHGEMDPNAIQPCGMSASEGGRLYFVKLHEQRNNVRTSDVKYEDVLRIVCDVLQTVLEVDTDSYPTELRESMGVQVFSDGNVRASVLKGVKQFITVTSQKRRGYTKALNESVDEITEQIKSNGLITAQ